MEEEAQFIEPDVRLKNKIGDVLKAQATLSPEALKKAEQLVNDGVDVFLEEAENELALLAMMVREKKNFSTAEIIKKTSDCAYMLKSRSGTFGYSLGSQAGKSLYDYVQHLTSLNDKNFKVIETHTGSLRAIFGNRIKGDGGEQGQALLKGLFELVKLF